MTQLHRMFLNVQHNIYTSLTVSQSEHLNSLVDDVLHCGLAGACTRSSSWPQDSFGARHNSSCSSPYRREEYTDGAQSTAENEKYRYYCFREKQPFHRGWHTVLSTSCIPLGKWDVKVWGGTAGVPICSAGALPRMI